jgi:hypothetical protein
MLEDVILCVFLCLCMFSFCVGMCAWVCVGVRTQCLKFSVAFNKYCSLSHVAVCFFLQSDSHGSSSMWPISTEVVSIPYLQFHSRD